MKKKDAKERLLRLGIPIRDSEYIRLLLAMMASEHESLVLSGIKGCDGESWKEIKGFRIAVKVITDSIAVDVKTKRQRVESADPTSED